MDKQISDLLLKLSDNLYTTAEKLQGMGEDEAVAAIRRAGSELKKAVPLRSQVVDAVRKVTPKPGLTLIK